jgi:Protein of unknown function (DUF2852)
MASAVNQEAYGNPAWGSAPPGGAPPWGNPGWGNPGGNPGSNSGWQGSGWGGPPPWHMAHWHTVGISRPMGIVLMILGFVFFWPVGLAILIAMIWSGRMGCWGRRRWAAYQGADGQSADGRGPAAPWQVGPWAAWKGWGNTERAAPTSGNRAFDEYKADTLRRLEEEQKEFGAFLERLRFAKDKAEFDEFMSERRQRPTPPSAPNEPAPQA